MNVPQVNALPGVSARTAVKHRREEILHADPNARRRRLNVVPYIDVMPVLLVIFMATAPLLNLGVDVELPQVSASIIEQPKQQIVIQIDQHGDLSLIRKDDKGAASRIALARDDLVQQVAVHRDSDPNLVALVAGDAAVRYESALAILQVVRTQAKVPHATLLAQSEEPISK